MGELYILNIPDNYSDLYKLPREVMTLIRKNFARLTRAYIEAESQYNLFLYDNDTFVVASYREYREYMNVVVRGECEKLEDMRTGKRYEPIRVKNQPDQRFDVAYVQQDEKESVFEVYFSPGTYKFFRIVK